MTIICFDIETIPVPLHEDLIFEISTSSKAPKNIKDPEKISAAIEAKVEKILDEIKFYPDGSRIICIGAGIVDPREGEVRHLKSACSNNEKELLEWFISYINAASGTSTTTLCGYNLKGFDMRHVVMKGMLYGVHPKRPFNKWKLHDLMRNDFTMCGDSYRPLKGAWNSISTFFSLPHSATKGSDVLPMWEDKRYEDIQKYCLEDVRVTGELALRLSDWIEF